MKHIIIIILTLLSITINAQGIRLNSKQSVIDSTRLNATGDSLYYYQNGLVLRVEGITGAGGGTSYNNLSETADTVYVSKYLDVDTSTLYVDATNNRVGIGTNSPSATLSGITEAKNLTRESLINFKVSDAGNSSFSVVNGTITNTRFIPTFLGYIEDDVLSHALLFKGFIGQNADTAISTPIINFQAVKTTDGTDPNNNIDVSLISNRPLFGFQNTNSYLMTILANGNVGIGTSSPQGFFSVERQFPSATTLGLTVSDPRYEGVFQIKTSSSNSFMPTFEGYGGVEDAAYPIGVAVQGSVDTSKDVSYATHGLIILQGREYDNFPLGAGPVENAPILTVKNYNNLLMKVEANGNVGIGDTSPDSKLEVNGSATNTSANNEGSDAIIDFSLSNIAYTDNTGNSITLTNIKDGGAYTLISTSRNVSTEVSFTVPTGFSIIGMGTVPRTFNKQHIYSFIVAGSIVYVTMGTEN